MSSENDLVKQESNLSTLSDSRGLPSKVANGLETSLKEIQDRKLLSTFGQIFAGLQVTDEFKKSVDKAVTYIAKIPKNLEKDFAAGDLHFMVKNDTGENLGAIVGADKMNRGFVRIEEAAPVSTTLSGSLASLAMQQQLAQIAEVINEVRSRVVELKTIHDRDLWGSLRGMHKQLNQIKDAHDKSTQRDLTIQAITVINETLGKIEQRIIDEFEKMPIVSENKVWHSLKLVFSSTYLPKLENGYELIQELFEYYLSAMQMLTYAYMFLGERNVAIHIFSPDKDVWNDANLSKMIDAESVRDIDSNEPEWYKAPEQYLQKIEKAAARLLKNDEAYLEIEITGDQIMEVIKDGECKEEYN